MKKKGILAFVLVAVMAVMATIPGFAQNVQTAEGGAQFVVAENHEYSQEPQEFRLVIHDDSQIRELPAGLQISSEMRGRVQQASEMDLSSIIANFEGIRLSEDGESYVLLDEYNMRAMQDHIDELAETLAEMYAQYGEESARVVNNSTLNPFSCFIHVVVPVTFPIGGGLFVTVLICVNCGMWM